MLFKFFVCPQKYNKSREREKDKNTPNMLFPKGDMIYMMHWRENTELCKC